MPNKNILISGSLVYDRIMDFPGYYKDHIIPEKIHLFNISFLINELRESFGGTAGNIAYNLALLEEKSTILTTVGKDFGEYKKWLEKIRIDISQLKVVKDKNTPSVYIITDKSDNQIAAFNPGAMTVARGTFSKKYLKSAWAIISPGNAEDMVNYAKLYQKAKVKYIFDPGQQIGALSAVDLKTGISGAEILIGNDYEIALICKKIKCKQEDLLKKVKTLIITKGELGSEIYNKKQKINIPPVKVTKVLDPTGAGDAYRSGLIKGLVNGWPIEKAAKLGSLVATYAVEKHGTQNHSFTQKQLAKKFKECYNEDNQI